MAGPQRILRIQVRAHALSTGEARTKPVYNDWDFYRTVGGSAPVKSAALAAFKTAIMTPLLACLSVSYVTDYTDVRWLDDYFDPFETTAYTAAGGLTADSLPSLNNAYCSLTTGFRGGSFRGAKRFGPLAESSTTLDKFTSGQQTLWATLCTAIVAGFSAGGFSYVPVVVSAKNSLLSDNPPTVSWTQVTAAAVNPVVGRMIRRYQGRRATV